MGKLHAHEFITLDGIIDDPEWSAGYDFNEAMQASIKALTGRCSAIILGRKTYEMFEPAWSVRNDDDDPLASFMNETTKFVVTSTLTDPTWQGTTVVPYAVDGIQKIKASATGDVFTGGSGTLIRSLIADGLLDELHLFVYPLALGPGSRLFPETAPPQSMTLAGVQDFGNDVIYLNYRLASAE